MEWDRVKYEATTFSPLKRSLSSQDALKPSQNKKTRISLSLSKSRKNKDLESITNTLNSLTTTTPNPSQQQENESRYFLHCEKKEEEKQSIKMELDQFIPLSQPTLEEETKQDIKKVEEFSSLSLPLPPIQDEEGKKLDAYACPICNKDLTYTKSSYLRQTHVEACILSSSSLTKQQQQQQQQQEEETTLEFDDCIFCEKDLSRLKQPQRQVHLNNCLDDIKPEQETPSFAGQPVPFLTTLEICPVCHEVIPFKNKSLKQKIQHTKQCAKQNKVSIVELLKKFQWIGWGHLPVRTSRIAIIDTPPTIPTPTPPIIQQYEVANLYDDEDEDVDDDFTRDIIIHKTNHQFTRTKPTRKEDDQDEELQTVLAMSKSMMKNKKDAKKKTIGIKRTDERDWNAANIWSMEESRKQANLKLDELLFSEIELNHSYLQSERERSIGYLQESKMVNKSIPFYWNLASHQDEDMDPFTFVSLFMRKQEK